MHLCIDAHVVSSNREYAHLYLLYYTQICDDTNQANGFAAVGTTAGIGRLSVSSHVVLN